MGDPSPRRGAFIVFEGLDRSGKSTQVARLLHHLTSEGREARLQKFPDRSTAIGKMIDAYLQSRSELDDRAIHLLFSANRWECAAAIREDLARGVAVVADRYAFSGAAFSAAKGLPFQFCLNTDAGLPLPDLTLYLTVSPEVAAARAAYGTERYETIQIQTQVRKEFALVADQVRARHGDDRWVEVDASGNIDMVEERIWNSVRPMLVHEIGTVGTLWA